MLNEEKIRTMNKLAMYEQTVGKKYLPVSKFYRSDYVGLALIRNFFLISFGYAIFLAGLGIYFGEYLMENIHKMDLIQTGIDIIAGYVIVLLVYTAFTYLLYMVKYHMAKKSVKGYYQELTKLEKMYNREEKKTQVSRRKTGGNDT